MGRKHYALVASLPAMPDLAVAERLPISPLRLRQRQKLLPEPDRSQLQTLGGLLKIHEESIGRTDAQVIQAYRQARREVTHPALRDFLDFRTRQMVVLAALRGRHRGLPPPDVREYQGLVTPVRRIVQSWNEPYFGLQHVHLWVVRAAELVESGRSGELQEFMWQLLWRRLTNMQHRDPFGSSEVFATVLKWHILRLWLARSATVAAERFRDLLLKVTYDLERQLS